MSMTKDIMMDTKKGSAGTRSRSEALVHDPYETIIQ